jgi:hypothetical protein
MKMQIPARTVVVPSPSRTGWSWRWWLFLILFPIPFRPWWLTVIGSAIFGLLLYSFDREEA